MPLSTPVAIPAPDLPLPTPSDLATWGARMQSLHTWMVNVSAPGQSALGQSAYDNALHAQTMAGQAQGSANFKGAWSSLTGALNMPASVSHSGKIWLLTANLANVTTATPGVSSSWLNISNFFYGVGTVNEARAALVMGGSTAKNLLVNGNFRINQRGFTSGATGFGASGATLDRWNLLLGDTLAFTTNADGSRIVTAPAAGLSQYVRYPIGGLGGDYVLTWTGTATATVNGAAVTKGVAFTNTTADQLEVRFVSGTVSSAQLERGTVATAFEQRPYEYELMLCKAYYERFVGVGAIGMRSYGSASDSAYYVQRFAEKIATPTITKVGTWTVTNCGQPTITDVTSQSCIIRATVTATGTYAYSTGAGQGIEIDAGY